MLMSLLAVLAVAAGLAAAAVGRNAVEPQVPRGMAVDAAGCAVQGGDFHPEAWRVPADAFAGYHCIFPTTATGDPATPASPPGATVALRAAAESRCTRIHQGEFVEISTFAYTGYGCTWLR